MGIWIEEMLLDHPCPFLSFLFVLSIIVNKRIEKKTTEIMVNYRCDLNRIVWDAMSRPISCFY